MTGRGIDQVLPHPGNPRLHEPYLQSAGDYVALAETANGPVPAPVAFPYVWGDVLEEFGKRRPDMRIVNLETAVTHAGLPAPKGINYRMHPANIPVLTAAEIDCCVLANNHILDWGEGGLLDTIRALDRAALGRTGAGADLREATAPAVLPLARGGRVLVFGYGSSTSGIPRSWAATACTAGINLLTDLSTRGISQVATDVQAVRRAGDLVVVSVHWGANWGYEIETKDIAFAHALIDDAGVDVIHGHSSHHPKAFEIYRGKPIFYGCGDFLNDYEGIVGYEAFRGDLILGYFPTVGATTGKIERLVIVPYQIRNFRLNRVSETDAAWLWTRLTELEQRFGIDVRLQSDGALAIDWH